MDTENVYGYCFKQRCIAVFLAYTADPKVKYLNEQQLEKLSKTLWMACKSCLKGQVNKAEVVFTKKDVDNLVLRRDDLFEKNENGYRVKNWSINGSGAMIFEKVFLNGRLQKEPKATRMAWLLFVNENKNENQ